MSSENIKYNWIVFWVLFVLIWPITYAYNIIFDTGIVSNLQNDLFEQQAIIVWGIIYYFSLIIVDLYLFFKKTTLNTQATNDDEQIS